MFVSSNRFLRFTVCDSKMRSICAVHHILLDVCCLMQWKLCSTEVVVGKGCMWEKAGSHLCQDTGCPHRPTVPGWHMHDYTRTASYRILSNSLLDGHSTIRCFMVSNHERKNEYRFILGLNIVIGNLFTTKLILSILLSMAYCKLIMGTNQCFVQIFCFRPHDTM